MASNTEIFIVLKAVDKASSEIKKMGGNTGMAFAGVAAAAVAMASAVTAAMIAVTKEFADTGEQIGKIALTTGMSTEAISVLKMAMEDLGGSVDSVQTAVKKMQINMADWSKSSKHANEALKPLHLSMKELKGLAPEEQFIKLGNAIAKLPDANQRAAEAQKIFGRSYSEILPLFEKGQLSLKDLYDQGLKTGTLFSKDMVKSAGDMDHAYDILTDSVNGLKLQLAAALAPAITGIVNKIIPMIQEVTHWVEQNHDLIATIEDAIGWLTKIGIEFFKTWSTIGLIIQAIQKVDSWLKENGLTWQQFGLLIKGAVLKTAADVVESFGKMEVAVLEFAHAPKEMIDSVKADYAQRTAELRQAQDAAWTEMAAIPAKKLAQKKQDAIDEINDLKTQMVGTSGEMYAALKAQVDEHYKNYKETFGETVTATQEALARARAVADKEMKQMANNALIWGREFVTNLQSGIIGKIPFLSSAVSRVASVLNMVHQSYNPLLPAQTWGADFVANYGTGIKGKLPNLNAALGQVENAFKGFKMNVMRMTDTSQDLVNLKALENQLKAIGQAADFQVTQKQKQIDALQKQFLKEDNEKRKQELQDSLGKAQDAEERASIQAEINQMAVDEYRQAQIDKINDEITAIRDKSTADTQAKQTEIDTLKATIDQKTAMNKMMLDSLQAQQDEFEAQLEFKQEQLDLKKQLRETKSAKEIKKINDDLQDSIEKEKLRVLKSTNDKALGNAYDLYTTESGYINSLIQAYNNLASAKARAMSAGGGGSYTLQPASSGKRAMGGPVGAGKSYLVGEAGPETFVPDVNGSILPANKTAAGPTIIVNVTGNTLLDSRAAEKIGDSIIDKLRLQLRLAT